MPANNSITSLTEEEKEQILKLSRQNTLEEGINYALRHMEKRCKEAGEEVIPLTPLEKLHVNSIMHMIILHQNHHHLIKKKHHLLLLEEAVGLLSLHHVGHTTYLLMIQVIPVPIQVVKMN